jgi:hypothetical protein
MVIARAGGLVVIHKSMIPSGLNEVLLWGPKGPKAACYREVKPSRDVQNNKKRTLGASGIINQQVPREPSCLQSHGPCGCQVYFLSLNDRGRHNSDH